MGFSFGDRTLLITNSARLGPELFRMLPVRSRRPRLETRGSTYRGGRSDRWSRWRTGIQRSRASGIWGCRHGSRRRQAPSEGDPQGDHGPASGWSRPDSDLGCLVRADGRRRSPRLLDPTQLAEIKQRFDDAYAELIATPRSWLPARALGHQPAEEACHERRRRHQARGEDPTSSKLGGRLSVLSPLSSWPTGTWRGRTRRQLRARTLHRAFCNPL